MGRLSEYDDEELFYIQPGSPEYQEPQYDKGFPPGSWATVRSFLPGNLYTDIQFGVQISLGGSHAEVTPRERVMIISRPGFGNPWKSAHLGVVYVLIPRIQRSGWMWAADLMEDKP